MPPATDPFEELEQQGYRVDRLIYGSSSRGSEGLKEPPPIVLSQEENEDGKIVIRIQEIIPRMQEKTGIQVGYQVLHLQGKNVADYEGGFEELVKTLKENLVIKVVVLKP